MSVLVLSVTARLHWHYEWHYCIIDSNTALALYALPGPVWWWQGVRGLLPAVVTCLWMVGGSELATRVWVLPEERCVLPNQAPDDLINHNVVPD